MALQEIKRGPASTESLRIIEAAPPFINQLLKAYPDISITEDVFDKIQRQASAWDTQLMLDHMNGEVDRTRFVSEFVGICDSSDQVQEALDEIAYKELNKLAKEPVQLQEEVFSTLQKETCSMDALLWLDTEHGAVTQQLKLERTPEAQSFRERNILAIEQAEKASNEQELSFFTLLLSGVQHSQKETPALRYLIRYQNGNLTEVHRRVTVPFLPKENRVLLEHLTPRVFQREYTSGELDPRTLKGFMWHFRKAGDPLVRVTANAIRSIRQTREETIKIQANEDRIRDYFASH